MEEMWKNSAIIAKRNVDSNQLPIAVPLIEYKQIIDVHSCIVLNQLPDENLGVTIDGFNEVFDIEDVTSKSFKVDYANGVLYFDPYNIGKKLSVTYSGIGYTLLSASRIITKYDKWGNVLETLEELIDKAKLCLEAIETLGGAVEVINKLKVDIESGLDLHDTLTDDIKIGTEVKDELVEKTNIANTTIETLIDKTNKGNETVSQLDKSSATATQKKKDLDQSISTATETNTILTNTNSTAVQTNLTLEQTITEAQEDIDKINSTGNKSLIVGSSQFVNNEYTWTHNMNSDNLVVNFIDSATDEPLITNYKIIDKNNVLVRNSTEHPNIKVILSASYYSGNSLFGTNVEEFAGDSVGIDERSVRLKNDDGTYENPVTNSDSVFMDDGETRLTKKIKGIDTTIEDMNYIKKFKYAMFTFEAVEVSDGDSVLVILLSNDGISWEKLDNGYTSKNLRDPYAFYKDGYYYITATNLVRTDKIIYIRTKDLFDFEEVEMNYAGLSSYQAIWSPSVFKYKNKYYMCVSLSKDSSSIYNMNQYISLLDDNLKPTTWTKLKLESGASSVYDGHIIPSQNKLYFYYKNTTVGSEGIEIASADNLTDTFKRLGTIESDNKLEAPYLMQFGKYLRLYTDTYEGIGGLNYKDMLYDVSENKKLLFNDGNTYKHCQVLDLTGYDWEMNFVFSAEFCEVKDCNDLSIKYYDIRSVTPSTLNLPSGLSSDDKWGKIKLYLAGGENFNQELHLLNNRHFYRNCVNKSWNEWQEVIQKGDFLFERKELTLLNSVQGGIDITIQHTPVSMIINVCGNITNIQNKSLIKIATLEENHRPDKNFGIIGVNVNNYNDSIKVHFMTSGGIELLINENNVTTSSNYIFFNTTFIKQK